MIVRWRGYLVHTALADDLGLPESERTPAGRIDPNDRWIGLMAQDVERICPEAVTTIGGYKYVDYDVALKPRHNKAKR